MSMPFYVSPEQVMKDRADYARKGIARGRSLVALECADGVAHRGREPAGTLYKISEIYDRIAFAGVGKYNEFEMLKIAGVRHADLKGYQYSREDVTARALANAYAQTLGQVFTHEMKPYEVEILVAQVGEHAGRAERAVPHPLRRHRHGRARLHRCSAARPRRSPRRSRASTEPGLDLAAAVQLGAQGARRGPARPRSPADQLEVALLDRQPAPAHVPPHRRRRARRAAAPADGVPAQCRRATCTIGTIRDRARRRPAIDPERPRSTGASPGRSRCGAASSTASTSVTSSTSWRRRVCSRARRRRPVPWSPTVKA